ncbi:hypothetical protein DXH95_00180 [Sphingorhabdus pulchriflava]|uniref:Uncharacterized protein n=1 Tax=Sphingorhabdus pulchriflava TaxID=2292257 RepID=A0A371BE79_9SPHN|nr:hypothetical protein [Sphingorhabdus pulchriflava]RDV05916.1 hypothetical protein DXH95_00180 [Sphingorhabdus pulchriflava]
MTFDNALSRFLSKNTVRKSAEMPVFHSTSAYSARRILFDNVINPQSCNVFQNEKLTYLFYGRPSYKRESRSQITKYWQLPAVFLFDYKVSRYKRIFPFDTGAFENGIYPEFFGMMPRNEYDTGSMPDSPSRLVSSFFVDCERFFKLSPRDKKDFDSRFETTAVDEEIHALYELIVSYSEKIDDRRFSIELQTEHEIHLSDGACKALIIPEEYLESDELVDKCDKMGIEVLSYPSFPLKQEMYYYHIYNIIFELYKEWGIAR